MTVILIIAAGLAAFLWWTYYRELGPCPRCRRLGTRKRFSTDGAYSRRPCGICGGDLERIRPLSLIWPKHREEARRRRDARKG
jgi:hypothetical protein